MYQLVNSLLLKKGRNQTWIDTDISNVLLSDVFTKYLDGFIVLTHTTSGSTPLYLDYKALKGLNIRYINMTFELWLLTVSSLPTTLIEPVLHKSNILFCDAYQARFNIRRDDNDLILHKDNINTDHLHNRVVTCVNGLLYPNIPDGVEDLKIPQGGLFRQPQKQNTVGLYSFAEIGDVIQVPISESMIFKTNGATKKNQSVIVKTNIDATGKSILLSIAGFLHANDIVYDVIKENPCTLLIRTNRLNILERLFILRAQIDISNLGLTVSSKAPDAIMSNEIITDEFINKYLSMLLSFIIVVDSPNIYTVNGHVINSKLPGFYESIVEPIFPLIGTNGKSLTYWRRKEVDRWVMDVMCDYKPNYLLHTTENENCNANNETLSEEQFKNLEAYLLGIYSARIL